MVVWGRPSTARTAGRVSSTRATPRWLRLSADRVVGHERSTPDGAGRTANRELSLSSREIWGAVRRLRVGLLSGLVAVITAAGLYVAVGGTGVAERAGRGTALETPAAAGPSSTLGSTPQSPTLGSTQHSPALGSTPQAAVRDGDAEGVNLPGDADAEPADFGGTPLVLALLFLGLLVGGWVVFHLWRRSRTTRELPGRAGARRLGRSRDALHQQP